MLLAPMIAINILLLPEPKAAERAQAVNARLRAEVPGLELDDRAHAKRPGFALDTTHVPHVSLMHLVVRASDVESLSTALRKAVSAAELSKIDLRAAGYDSGPWNGGMMVSIHIERSPELVALQSAVLRAAAPFAHSDSVDEGMFETEGGSPQDSAVNAETIDYVRTFSEKRTGEHFSPHITVGLAAAGAAQRLRSEPFQAQSYRIESLAIYQLGNDGTARRELTKLVEIGR